jgi:hypothetical protein
MVQDGAAAATTTSTLTTATISTATAIGQVTATKWVVATASEAATAVGNIIRSTVAEPPTGIGPQPINLVVPLAGIPWGIVRLALVRTLARGPVDAEVETLAVSVRIAVPAAEGAPERVSAAVAEIVSAIGKRPEVRGPEEVQAPLVAVVARAAPQLVPVAPVVRQASEEAVAAAAGAGVAAVAGGAGECNEPRNKGRTNEIENTEPRRLAYAFSHVSTYGVFRSGSTFARRTAIETND